MQLTKGAIGNLINRYKAVLKKCHLMNTFGSLAVAGMLVMGGAGMAGAEGRWTKPNGETAQWTNGVVSNGTVLQGTYEGFSQEEETLAGVATVDYATRGVSVANGTTFTSNSKTAGAAGALKLLNGIKIGDNVTFTGNKATGNAWGGGAIYIKLADKMQPSDNQSVTIGSNAKFVNNQAQTWGGAIALEYGNLTIDEGAIFEGNKTLGKNSNGEEGGGAIAVWHDPSNGKPGQTRLSVTKATFRQNSTNVSGGAIYNKDGNITITGSQFDQNSSGSMGGAIANMSGNTDYTGEINITASGFTGNTAGNGGAVWNGTNGKVNITNSTFSKNTAMLKDHSLQQGGAITNGGEMTITGSTFEGNQAGKIGGAIFNSGTLTINGGGFEDNTAKSAAGAIYNAADAKLTVDGVTFANNSSAIAGAINNRDGDVTITDSTFTGNDAGKSMGGAIRNDSGDTTNEGAITITGSTFEGNTAGNGGAVWNGFDGTVNITGSTFKGNTAVAGIGQGGAITNADEMTITGSTFEGNRAGKLGGAIFNAANGKLTFNGTNTFTNNTAADNTNDIYNAGTITVADGTTTLNSGLKQVGGNITVKGGTLYMASGSSLSFDTSSTLTINGGAFVADAGLLVSASEDGYQVNGDNGISDDNIVGTTGNLNLRWFDGDYTVDEYTSVKDALLNSTQEGAALNILDATWQGGDDEILVAGADGNGRLTTGSVVVNKGSADVSNNGTSIPSTPENYVAIVDNTNAGTLLQVSTITTNGNSITAKGLEIADANGADAVTLNVTSNTGTNSTLTLVGDSTADTGVINKSGQRLATKAVVEADNTLNMGLAGNLRDQGLTLTEATVKGTLNANGGVAGTTSEYAINTLTMEHGSKVNVLDSVMQIDKLNANGGTMFVDPSYVSIDGVNGDFNTTLLVGTGSTVNIGGMSTADLSEALAKAGMSVGPNFTVGASQSVLVLSQALTLGSAGKIVVDADVTDTGSISGLPGTTVATAHFGDGSLLVVNGNTINGATAAIDLSSATTKTLNVENGAKLLIANAVAGTPYTIIDGETNTSNAFNGGAYADAGTTGWKGSNLLTSSDMLTLTSTDGTVFMAKSEDSHTVFPKLSHELATAVNTLYGQKLNNVDADAMGVRFLSRATDKLFLGADKDAAAATIESAARIAFAGAVPQMTKMASDAGSNAVVNRLGFANPADGAQAMNAEGKIVDRNTTGFALWIAPLWQSQHGWGMEADNLDYGFNGNLGGVSLGADYTFENAIRAGITFNIGGGYAESSGGDLNSTENRMSFWGLGAYAGWNYENFGLMADVSYTSTWNDLKQDMDSRMGMGDLEADVQASAISAGLRAEYKLETSVLDVIPHIGVRYMSLNTWGFDAESNGGTVLEGDGFHQDIWTFPVGVTFTKDFTLDSGWSFKPSIDFSVIPAAGDIKAKQDVAFTGLPGSYEVETQMMDYLTWQGGVGLEMGNDTMSFGVNYTLQAGQHTTGHGVFGSFRYEF